MSDLRRQLIRSLAEEGGHLRVVRSLPDVLREIAEAGPIVWNSDKAVWGALTHKQRGECLDRLDDLQAEARALIEDATGVSWDKINEACL